LGEITDREHCKFLRVLG